MEEVIKGYSDLVNEQQKKIDDLEQARDKNQKDLDFASNLLLKYDAELQRVEEECIRLELETEKIKTELIKTRFELRNNNK